MSAPLVILCMVVLGMPAIGERTSPFLTFADLDRSAVQEALELVAPGALPGLRTLLEDISHHGGGQVDGPHCATCAVVGGSGSLTRATLGREIDSHDCVIRVNTAPTEKFEHMVGSKHTVHVWSVPVTPGTLGDVELLKKQQEDLAMFSRVAEGITVHHFSNALSAGVIVDMVKNGKVPSAKLRVLHPNFYLDLCSKLGSFHCDTLHRPSTGLLAIRLSLKMCESPPSVYGFDPNSLPFHYYEPPDDVCSATIGARIGGAQVHNFTMESEHLRKWHDESSLRLWQTDLTPAWNNSHCHMPRALQITSVVPTVSGLYRLQPYLVNGKVVFENREDVRGEEFYRVLYFQRCDVGDRGGAYFVTSQQHLVSTQKITPGQDFSCSGSLFSADFRPEVPALGTWTYMDPWQGLLPANDHFSVKRVAGRGI